MLYEVITARSNRPLVSVHRSLALSAAVVMISCMMRILHLADVHLGASYSSFGAHAAERSEAVLRAFRGLPEVTSYFSITGFFGGVNNGIIFARLSYNLV